MFLVLTIKQLLQKHGLGLLTVKGDNLRINKLSTDTEEVAVEGNIFNLSYSEKTTNNKDTSIFSKIFK